MFDSLIAHIRSFYPDQPTVPLHAPHFIGNEKKYLSECIDTTYVSYVGAFVTSFEEAVRKFTGHRYSLSLANGTLALHLSLLISGVKPGDEVILPALTFVAAANAVSHANAHCVLVDSEPESLGLCPEKLKEFLKQNVTLKDQRAFNKTSGRFISACVPVHIFGHPAQTQSLKEICDLYNIPMIEDCSESLGSYTQRGHHTGHCGSIAVLSFNGNKIATTGGGGMLLTNDAKLAAHARHLATTAKVPHAYEFSHDEVGYNYRMPNINAAVGLAQIESLNSFLSSKRQIAQSYKKFFADSPWKFLDQPSQTKSNFWLNAVILNTENERNELLDLGLKTKIQMRPIWKLMHHLPMYENCQRTTMAVAEAMEKRIVNLPSSYSPLMKDLR